MERERNGAVRNINARHPPPTITVLALTRFTHFGGEGRSCKEQTRFKNFSYFIRFDDDCAPAPQPDALKRKRPVPNPKKHAVVKAANDKVIKREDGRLTLQRISFPEPLGAAVSLFH